MIQELSILLLKEKTHQSRNHFYEYVIILAKTLIKGGRFMNKKLIETIVVFIFFVLLLNLIASIIVLIDEAASTIDLDRIIYLHMLGSFLVILVGLLLERKTVISIFRTKTISFNASLMPSLILLVVGFLHPVFYMKIEVFTIERPFPIGDFGMNILYSPLFQGSSIQYLIVLFVTVTIIKNLSKKDKINT